MVTLNPLAVRFPPQVVSANLYLKQSGRVGQWSQELVTPSEKLQSLSSLYSTL